VHARLIRRLWTAEAILQQSILRFGSRLVRNLSAGALAHHRYLTPKPACGGDRGYGLATRASGPPGTGAWVRGPLARLVRGGLGTRATGPPGAGDEGYYLGPPATGLPGAGDEGYYLGPPATGPPGAERLLTARWIIGLLKYPLKLGKIRRGQGWVINNQ